MAIHNEIFHDPPTEAQSLHQESSAERLALQAQTPPPGRSRESSVVQSQSAKQENSHESSTLQSQTISSGSEVLQGQYAPQDDSHQSSVFETQKTGTAESGASQRSKDAPDSAALVQNGKLPDLQIDGANTNHENGFMHLGNPLNLVEAAATGLAVGLIAPALVPAAINEFIE